ncbi:LANO_0C00100g1_1 [Lachancea nothofagi CBS 11611]|uniref:LANO_0C00100g1_1 n=1 Tax=Lachancea nothofagi CBS 11611 TaxID=1266666 RepID=A0A1G4J2R9_9SACH|nr:LANO_0C00100g1_1 [Lachancea nothofagi CBS 11611]
MLTDTDGLGSILETLVKMTVFDWKVREPGIPYFKPKLATLSNTRHSLDTLKFFLINATLAVAPTSNMHSPFDKNSPSGNMWNYVTSIYHEVFKEQSTIASYRVLLQRPDGVSVSDKLLNKNKIQWFYGNRKMQCDKLIWGLRNYFRLPTVEDLAVDLLHCDEISLTESRFNPKGSLLDLFPSEYLQSLLPSFARYEMLSEEQQAYVFESIDKITENLIWMVYLGCGYSYRFPELVDITYAGPNRALFIDNDTRCLVLFTTYTKGDKSTKPLTKRLDATTSKYLLYHIVILRQIQANLLGPEYCEVNPEHWPRFHGSSIELSQYILHQYVFFSIKESTLLRQKGFNDMLVKELGFNTRELRQAMVAIMRNYVKRSSVSEVYHTMTQELMFGHSVRTGLESYGLDSFSFDSVTASTATYFQAVASESWHNWIELESSFRTPQVNGIPSEQDIQELEGYVDTLKTALHNIRFSATAKKLRELPSIVPTTGLSGYLASQKAARRPGIATTLDQLQQVAHVLRSNAEM